MNKRLTKPHNAFPIPNKSFQKRFISTLSNVKAHSCECADLTVNNSRLHKVEKNTSRPISRVLSPWGCPHSVWPFIWSICCQMLRATNPGGEPKKALKLAFRATPIRSCSEWGLPCQPCCQACGGLLPHLFTLTTANCGGLFSVALSLKSPSLAVSQHPISVEPGLSSLAPLRA